VTIVAYIVLEPGLSDKRQGHTLSRKQKRGKLQTLAQNTLIEIALTSVRAETISHCGADPIFCASVSDIIYLHNKDAENFLARTEQVTIK
jgi:hypothetical protein